MLFSGLSQLTCVCKKDNKSKVILSNSEKTYTNWLAALESRHLTNLKFSEVTRALRALSSAYVQRRHTLSRGGALNGAGKRAAFALFYGPLHFLIVKDLVHRLRLQRPKTILDLGCGTGAAGAAWALTTTSNPRIIGIDRHPWSIAETRWTYKHLNLKSVLRTTDLVRLHRPNKPFGIVAAYILNELNKSQRTSVLHTLFNWASDGVPLLIIEPISKTVSPWWDDVAQMAVNLGGRCDQWRWSANFPPLLKNLAHAAGLNHQKVAARSMLINR